MDYSKLPDAILKKIATDHLNTLSDHIAFSQVCKSWRSIATASLLRCRRHGRPGLLISHKSKPPIRTPLEFFPVGTPALPLTPTRPSLFPPPPPTPAKKSAKKPLNQPSPAAAASFSDKLARNQCVGSKDGWLLLLHPGNRRRRNNTYLFRFYLHNPITSAHVSLPDLTLENKDNEPAIFRTVISSSPDDDVEQDCHVFVVFEDTLAWSSCTVGRGGQNWKLAALHELDMDYIVRDASYSRGKLFLVGSGNRFVVVDVIFGNNNIYHSDDTNKQQIVKVKPSSQVFYLSREMLDKGDRADESRFSHLCHLDEEKDDFPLVIISRCTKDGGVTFRCYKLVLLQVRGGGVCSRDEGIEWKEVTSLDGFSVFLGSHQSFAFGGVADNNGVNYGVGANRVYFSFCFAEHGLFMNHDMFWSCHQNKCGVLDLAGGGEVEWFHPCRGLGDHNYVWFLPSPWEIIRYMQQRKAKKPDRLPGKKDEIYDN